MKQKIFSIILLVSVILSCKTDEFLDTTPYGLAVDGPGTFFRNADDALLAINVAYVNLRHRHDSFSGDYAWGNIGTDDAWKGGNDVSDEANLTQKENYSIEATVGGITGRWEQSFQGISNANKVIENVPGIDMDDALKNRILGEAYFLRGVYYMDLAKWFGGVPIFEENLATPDAYFDVPRSSKEETWAFVEENLLEALQRLPNKSEYPTEDLGRATKGAALGYLVRANALQNDMAEVKKYSEDLFALSEYTLAPTYREIWQPDGENGSGSIFEIQYKDTGDRDAALGRPGNFAFGPRSPNPYSGWGFVQARQELLDEFEPEDPRKEHSFAMTTGNSYGPIDNAGTAYFGKKVLHEPFSDYPRSSHWRNGHINWRALRLADIYLMYAESIYQSDPATAMNYVNLVRARAREGNPSILPDITGLSDQELLDAIYHERRVELNLEGVRFHDLIRTGRTDLITPYGFQLGKHEKMPIPQEEIDNYGGKLDQNTGY